jgi:hypothetical protein
MFGEDLRYANLLMNSCPCVGPVWDRRGVSQSPLL